MVEESGEVSEDCGWRKLRFGKSQGDLPHGRRVEGANLEALEVDARLGLVRVALGELLEGQHALHQRGLHTELVHVDQWAERHMVRKRREVVEGGGIGDVDEGAGRIDGGGCVGRGRVEEGRKLGIESEIVEEEAWRRRWDQQAAHMSGWRGKAHRGKGCSRQGRGKP